MDNPEVKPGIRLMVKQQNHDLKSWKKGLSKNTAAERYIQLRNTRPNLVSLTKKKDVAGHLGIKDTSLSRLLRKL